MDVNVNIESANDINSPDLTIISTEVDMNVDVNSESGIIIVSNSESEIDSTDLVDHLERYTTSNQVIVHNVPGDGNCVYNAVLYQLESNGIITTTVENLRQTVANTLEEHADIYMPFVISPIASDHLYDTSTPDAIDDFISLITVQYTSSVLAYEKICREM